MPLFRETEQQTPDASTGRLMLAVLGGLADVERGLIRTRTAEVVPRPKESIWASPFSHPAQRDEATKLSHSYYCLYSYNPPLAGV